MKKITLQIEVEDKILDESIAQDNYNEFWHDKAGKKFLFKKPLGYELLVVEKIDEPTAENKRYARIFHYILPMGTQIVEDDSEEKTDRLSELYKLCNYNFVEVLNAIDSIKDKVSTEGIKENTLLEALKIVTHSKD